MNSVLTTPRLRVLAKGQNWLMVAHQLASASEKPLPVAWRSQDGIPRCVQLAGRCYRSQIRDLFKSWPINALESQMTQNGELKRT